MSVIVMGGELPTGYDDCWYLRCEFWRNCAIDGKQYNCSLRPLPEKHGRLIDADALYDALGVSDEDICFKHMLEECQTIVEAEGE